MVSFEEAGEMLDRIAESLPQEFYNKLNGGIILQPEAKLHKEAKANDLFVLGEYHVDNLGRYIYIYYGSFIKIHGHLSNEAFEEKLKSTLVHEFTHHLESLAGDRTLEIKDEIFMAKYNQNRLNKENKESNNQ